MRFSAHAGFGRKLRAGADESRAFLGPALRQLPSLERNKPIPLRNETDIYFTIQPAPGLSGPGVIGFVLQSRTF
jgi:hypothetical protein